MGDWMKIGLGAGFAITCLVASAPASAQVRSTANASATPVTKASATRDPNRIVCVNQDVLGSRLGSKRVCRTAAQWEMYEREIRNTTDRMQNGKYSKEGAVVFSPR